MGRRDLWRRERWFALALLFLMVNGYGVLRFAAGPGVQAGHRAVRFRPGQDRTVEGSEPLSWRFARDIVTGGSTGRWEQAGPVIFEPMVAGHFCWASPRELVFRPAAPWPPCHRYRALFDTGFTAADGGVLGRQQFRFQTPLLRLAAARQVEYQPAGATVLRLEFNLPPARHVLGDYLELRSGDGRRIGFEILGDAATRRVLIRTGPVEADAIEVTVREGLPAAGGALGMAQSVTRRLPCVRELRLQKVEACSPSFEPGRMTVVFSTPVDPARLGQYIAIEPPVAIAVARTGSWRHSGCRITGDFEPRQSYRVTFHKGLPAANGAVLRTEAVRRVYFPDRPAALGFRSRGHYLSSRGRRAVALTGVNAGALELTAERLFPNNLVYYAMRKSGRFEAGYGSGPADHLSGISHVTGRREITPAAEPNRVWETAVELDPLAGEFRTGAFLLTARGKGGAQARQLVALTDIGIAVKRSAHDLLVWANSIRDLAPVTGATVRVYSTANQELLTGLTDAQGLIHFHASLGVPEARPFLVTVTRGEDLAYLILDGTQAAPEGETEGRPYLREGYEAYVYTDRGVYRHGETAHVRLVIRDGNLTRPPPFPLVVRCVKPDGREYRRYHATLGELGTAGVDVAWPDFLPCGTYRLEAVMPGTDSCLGAATAVLEEFVPPRIRVAVHAATNRVGRHLSFEAEARHLFGPPAADHLVRGHAEFQPVPFTHPDWPGYVFSDDEKEFAVQRRDLGARKLDSAGRAPFQFELPSDWQPPSALRVVMRAEVTETSGRSVSAWAVRTADVHSRYIGLRAAAGAGTAGVGQEVPVAATVVWPDGTTVSGDVPVRVCLGRESWCTVLRRRDAGRYGYDSEKQIVPAQEYEATLVNGRGELRVRPRESGMHVLRVTGVQSGASASIRFYAGTPDQEWLTRSLEQPGQVLLRLDRAEYSAGDEASLLVQAPFAGRALVTVESDRIMDRRVLDLVGNTTELKIPIEPGYAPNAYCSVVVIRAADESQVWMPHRAVGVLPLKVVDRGQELMLHLDAPSQVRPRTTFRVKIRAETANGRPASAEVTVAAVDEGICRLTAFPAPDPLAFFRMQRGLGVDLYDLYGELLPEIDERLAAQLSAPSGGSADALRGRLNPVTAQRFRPVALWVAPVTTDAAGAAEAEIALPEFTGSLRIMAVGTAARSFGSAVATVMVKRPLVVQPSLPRFLAPSDSCAMSVRIFNESGGDRHGRLEISCTGPLAALDPHQEVALPAGGDLLVRPRLQAGAGPGKATVRICLEAGDERYVNTIELAVRPGAPRDQQAGFGSVAPDTSAQIAVGGDWFEGTGRRRLWCSGLPTVKLGEALVRLLDYPYGCLEQTTSSSFPLLYLADLATLVRPGSIGGDETAACVQAGLYRILSMQQADGGFGYWPGRGRTYPWGSVYATHFLVECRTAGYDVPAEALELALRYVAGLVSRSPGGTAAGADPDSLRTQCYAVHVLALAGRAPAGWEARLLDRPDPLDATARIHLAAALAASDRRAAAAEWVGGLDAASVAEAPPLAGGSLNSGTRNLALLLSTRLDVHPEHPSVPVLAARLEAAAVDGSWRTTQENAAALLALGKYSRYLQRGPSGFEAEVTLAATGAEPRRIKGPQPVCFELAAEQGATARIHNRGPGTLFYYWRSEGIPARGTVPEEDRGLSVRRTFYSAAGTPLEGRALSQGEALVVEIALDSGSTPLQNVAVEDLLPAGIEVENPRLRNDTLAPWAGQPAAAIQSLDARDDRLIVFLERVQGRCTYYYAARAVTPGNYLRPPIAAACMYEPAVRSVHGSGRIAVEAGTDTEPMP